ncbi:MAG: hypothetical protein IT518_09950 [Burkholderiales bacterium]|nr:hypothetical protein [Burkholderiales bacterium]
MPSLDEIPRLPGSGRRYELHVGGWPAALLGVVVGAVVLAVGVLFSLVVLPVLLIAAVAGGGYFWWKTRAMRKALRQNAAARSVREREVEGEIVHVDRPVAPRA